METLSEIIEAPEKPTLLERIGEMIVVPLMLGIIALGFIAVCLRFMFGGHLALFWSEEVIRYAFIWLFWLCAPLLVFRGAMFSVDLVLVVLPPVLQWVVKLATNLAIIFLMSIYAWYGWGMAVLNGPQLSSALSLSMFWIYLAIPFGAALIVIVMLIQTVQLLMTLRTQEAKP